MGRSLSDSDKQFEKPAVAENAVVAAVRPLSYRARVIWIAGSLYVFSLFLPSIGESFDNALPGFTTFQLGLSAIVEYPKWDSDRIIIAITWCLNPAVWLGIALMAMRRSRLAGCAGGLGVGFGLVFLPRFWYGVAVLPGYWVWLASAASLLAFGWYPALKQSDAG